jgi:hypothetical protein
MTKDGKIGTLRDRPGFVAVSSGRKFSGEHARQLDFPTPYLKLILGTTGHDLTFFSVEGTGAGPKVVAEATRKTNQALQAHFVSLCLGSECNLLPSLQGSSHAICRHVQSKASPCFVDQTTALAKNSLTVRGHSVALWEKRE